MIAFAQAILQLKIVFDDAVVYHDDATCAVALRVRVLFRRTPVRSPARVAYAVSAIQRVEANCFLKIPKLSFRATNLKIVLFINDSNASRIVSAIFQLPQPVNDDRHNLLVANVTNNATHDENRVMNDE